MHPFPAICVNSQKNEQEFRSQAVVVVPFTLNNKLYQIEIMSETDGITHPLPHQYRHHTVDNGSSSSLLLEPSIANHDDGGNLTSPLLLPHQEYNDSHNSDDDDEDDDEDNEDNNLAAEQKEDDNVTLISNIQSKEYYDILLMSMCTMTFMILVLNSYFFEWSDTVLNVQMDTLIVVGSENNATIANGNINSNSNSSSNYSGGEKRLERGETISVDLVRTKKIEESIIVII